MASLSYGNVCLILYAVAWIVTYIAYRKKNKSFNASCFIILLYGATSICSAILYNLDGESYRVRHITLLPLIYLFLLLNISFLPIIKFNASHVKYIKIPNRILLNYLSAFLILCTIAGLSVGLSDIISRMTLLLVNADAGRDAYYESMEAIGRGGEGGIKALLRILSNVSYNFVVLCFFLYCSFDKNKFAKAITLGLFACMLIGLFLGFISGSRGGAVNKLLVIIATYFLMKPFLKESVNKFIKKIGISIIILFLVPFMAITFSRFGQTDNGVISSMLSYGGQSILNFDEYAFDNNGIRYGDRTMPIFKKLLGFSDVPDNFFERRDKYPNLKINDEVFVTYIGDFVLDFGAIAAFVIIIILTVLALQSTRTTGEWYPFYRLILLHLVLCIISQGLFLYSFADAGNYSIIAYITYYIIFQISEIKIYHKR